MSLTQSEIINLRLPKSEMNDLRLSDDELSDLKIPLAEREELKKSGRWNNRTNRPSVYYRNPKEALVDLSKIGNDLPKDQEVATTKGEWVQTIIDRCEAELKLAPTGTKASCFQALAIMCFQRSTELAVNSVIEAVDQEWSNAFNIPVGEFEGVSMLAAVRKAINHE